MWAHQRYCRPESLQFLKSQFLLKIVFKEPNISPITNFKVHLTPKYFFHSNKSLHLFDTHCAFLSLFNPNFAFLQAVKVTKSGHHLAHDQVGRMGSILALTSQTSLHACLQRLNTMQISLWHRARNRPIPITSSVVWQMMARLRNFYNLKEVKT